ncbi:MAG: DUF2523 family protein [Colwellia sp.]
MKKLLFLFIPFFLFLFLPFEVFSDTYQDAAGTSQMVADSFDNLWGFFFDDVPNMFQRFTSWAVIWFVKIKLYFYLESIKFFWGVAKVIIADLNIMSQITANMSLLPQDVRQACVDMRFFDGVNLLLNAFLTKFIMNLVR